MDEQHGGRVEFFKRRYSSAYAVARGLLSMRWAAAGVCGLMGVGSCASASGGGFGSESLAVAGLFFIMVGALAWFALGAAATFIRVMVDVAVNTAPGLTDEERLGLLDR